VYRVLAVLLGSQGELAPIDCFEFVAHQVVENHILGLFNLAGGDARSVVEEGGLAAAELLTHFHPAQETSDPINLFAMCITETLETGDEFFGRFAALSGLLLNFIEQAVQFRVDLKERICFGNR
jgi:hypothetical protein